VSESATQEKVSAGKVRARTELPAWARLLRPQQWVKNVLVFAALVFARKLFDPHAFLLATLAFGAFCLASSSVYVVNDLIDADRDRLHPEKQKRPIASGAVPPGTAKLLALALTAVSLGLSFGIGLGFGLSVLLYLSMTHFYSVAGKNVVVLDVMLIAAGFVIRAAGGALAIDVPMSNWFILCTLFLALFIALEKRKAEMLALEDGAGRTRPVLGTYTLPALSAYTATSMGGVLISYALYLLDLRHLSGRSFQILALTFPFVMFAIFRYHLLVETERLGEKAEEIVLVDRPMQVCILGFAAVAVAAIHLAS
jgi:4-hydroxybenzoate polyprenyltransferase